MAISLGVGPVGGDSFALGMMNLRQGVRRGLIDPQLGTLPVQARLLTERCMAMTAPGTAAQGKKRVALDVAKIFHPVDPTELRDNRLAGLVRRSDKAGWQAFSDRVKSGPLAGTVAVTPTHALHAANRDRRGRGKRTNFVTLWKQRGDLKRLTKSLQDRVGWARAGWLRAYAALGGTRVGSWVARHGNAPGMYVNGTSNPRAFIEVRNMTKWSRRGGDVVAKALAFRARDMNRYFQTMMSLAARGKATPFQAAQASLTRAA
jgi:hypothetical protein